MKITTLLLLTLFPFLIYGQSDFCEKTFGESYYPLKIGFEKHLTWGNATYIEKVTGTTKKEGIEYFNYEQDFGAGTSYNLLLRKQNDTVFMYNEEQKKDVILLIERPVVGTKWESGKVIDTNGFFESPFCNYENLLVIENKYSSGDKEKRFYKKGLGLVAVTTNTGIKGMCVPNEEETKALTKPLSAFECTEETNKEAIAKCTMTYIHSYLIGELKKKKLKTPKEEGILKFDLHFDKNGKVSEIKSLNSLKGGNQATKEIMDILYSLPKLRPAMTSEKKSVGTKIELSIPIKTK
ncbi:hypothetical protein M8845_19125 [Gelidibacter japonicus]|uniref:hypothetical protein n=1 Tax=Gelidibacter japonicus TaxID=1962232 RepID=UPI00202084B2|nr:hypothetical protein [Gelidibacter japonicus]MCL8009541.1 hypothetical protein [Gelidibacter japonicus]